MFNYFKRFLKDAELIESKKVLNGEELTEEIRLTSLAKLLKKKTWTSVSSLGLIMINLAYNNMQIQWYIQNLAAYKRYLTDEVQKMLYDFNLNERSAASVINAFKHIVLTPLGTVLNFGKFYAPNIIERNYCKLSNNIVLLYAIYKFAQTCNLGLEFNLSCLLNKSIVYDCPSPVEIFGILDIEGESGIRSRLMGLSAVYSDLIHVTFTNDLQTIIIQDIAPCEVLKIFSEE